MTAPLTPPRAESHTVPDSSEAAIHVDRLVKTYKTTRAVDDISFTIPRGSVTGLLGGNGAGKTTTISMIMGWCRRHRAALACSAMRCLSRAPKCSAG